MPLVPPRLLLCNAVLPKGLPRSPFCDNITLKHRTKASARPPDVPNRVIKWKNVHPILDRGPRWKPVRRLDIPFATQEVG